MADPRDRPPAMLYKPHPWHGVPLGDEAPDVVTVYIEIVPTDTVKYEIDKQTGYLRVDRPQKYSSICPTLYGFLPQTLAAERVADLTQERLGRRDLVGDQDPMDVCVVAERNFFHGDVLVRARPVGGLRMLDGNEADDKIVAVLEGDAVFGTVAEIEDLPRDLVERLRHYFLTYKDPLTGDRPTEIPQIYGAAEARNVIERSREDYRNHFFELVRGPS